MEWININDCPPSNMEVIRVFIENPYFGSFERAENAVYLHFKGMDEGAFYDSEAQIHLDYVTKWKKAPNPPEEDENP